MSEPEKTPKKLGPSRYDFFAYSKHVMDVFDSSDSEPEPEKKTDKKTEPVVKKAAKPKVARKKSPAKVKVKGKSAK